MIGQHGDHETGLWIGLREKILCKKQNERTSERLFTWYFFPSSSFGGVKKELIRMYVAFYVAVSDQLRYQSNLNAPCNLLAGLYSLKFVC